MYDYGGGGGWGDPLDRDPQAVLDDVLDEYVSVEGAEPRLRRRAHRLARGPHARGRRRRDRAAPRRAPRRRRGLTMGYRVGVDVGGTFTDLICVTPDGRGRARQDADHARRPVDGVMNGLGAARRAVRPARSPSFCAQLDIVVHGTTTADNTMIEMNGAPTGLLVTEGHRDEIEMRRGPQGGDLGPDLPGARPRSPAAGPASRSPSASTSRATVAARRSTRTPCARGVQRLQAARRARRSR